MEAAAATGTNNPINGRREGEARRLHIIYFLSCIQHPHLIRVHHLNRSGGVFLRDVKRWMGELRGKDMPDSFSWSYKRRYKTGYVWQDLMDDDLITPISDNQYVLKGSQISVNFDACKQGTRTPSSSTPSSSSSDGGQFKQLLLRPRANKQEAPDQHHLTTINSPTSPTTHTTSLNSASSSRYSSFQQYYRQEILESSQYLNIDNVDGLQETVPTGEASSNAAASSSLQYHTSQSPLRSRRSQQRRRHSNIPIASRMLRKLMTTCRVDVDTNDTALVVSNKSSNFPTLLSNQQSSTRPGETQSLSSATNHKVVKRLHSCNQQHDGTSTSARDDYEGIKGSTKAQRQPVRFCRETDVCAAYRPVGAPTCMQCGKSFRPEKMHLHMTMSCKGTRPVKNYDTSSPENPPDHITQTCGSLVLAATSSLPQVFSN